MNINTEQKINLGTIVLLALLAVGSSPQPMMQATVFSALVAVLFGRDFVLKKFGALK